ncbi:hypothetical protein BKA62DRAFT_230047 [Auriculariales sp. MPI-PUGE-AT-0066]|nr:hypothetical protein BKA62DRAFT_230047 [Auriculariales sp. MPI-PUGE-AT-0066]
MDTFMEQKTDTEDPFDDAVKPPAGDGSAKEPSFMCMFNYAFPTLGQMGYTFHKIMAMQNRTHLFSVYYNTLGKARIIRWDRAVILVSESFQMNVPDSPLAEFFYRYSRVSREVAGHDTTIHAARPDEIAQAEAHFQDFEKERTIYQCPAQLEPIKDKKFSVDDYLAIEVPQNGEKPRTVIAKKLKLEIEDPLSRATRGYRVYDPADGRMGYLKDSWPVKSLAGHECEVLKDLRKHNVPHVPTLICGGPIERQSSICPSEVSEEWNKGCRKFDPRTHQRFLVREIGFHLAEPLEPTPQSQSRDLIARLKEALIAHRDAWKMDILHRDISDGNVLHYRHCDKPGDTATVTALLLDWDLAKRKGQEQKRRERTGTWFFHSINLLSTSMNPQCELDDLESFVWLVVYLFLRFLRRTTHGKNSGAYTKWLIDSIFDEATFNPVLRRWVGGGEKYRLVTNGHGIKILGKSTIEFSNNSAAGSCFTRLLAEINELKNARDEDDEVDTSTYILGNHDRFIAFLDQVIASSDWPTNDVLVDQCPDGRALPHSSVNQSQSHKQQVHKSRELKLAQVSQSMRASSGRGQIRSGEDADLDSDPRPPQRSRSS